MGDHILKTKLLMLLLLTNFVFADANMSWVDQKIEEIKPERSGLNARFLSSIKNPFIIVKSESKGPKTGSKAPSADLKKDVAAKPEIDMSKAPLTLQIVMNSSALINGKWIKENEFIRGYKLTQIQSDYVVLERKSKKLKLFIAKKSKNLNISTK